MSAKIPCDFCPRILERDMTDSSGEGIVGAQLYYFGHPECVRAFYARLFERKLNLFERATNLPEQPEPKPSF
jgi:hypothetical protein